MEEGLSLQEGVNAHIDARGSSTRSSLGSREGRGATRSLFLGSYSEGDCGISKHLLGCWIIYSPLNNAVEFRLLTNFPQTQHSENDAVNCPKAVKLPCLPVNGNH